MVNNIWHKVLRAIYARRGRPSVSVSYLVCLFVCLFVSKMTEKLLNQFSPISAEKMAHELRKTPLEFGGNPVTLR